MSTELTGQDAVEQAEPTAPESAPVEQTATEPESTPEEVESPASAETEPLDDSKNVPYDRFKEVNTEKQTLKEENERLKAYLAQQTQPSSVPAPELDEDAQKAVQNLIGIETERRENLRFETKHAKEFGQDKLLQAAYGVEVAEDMRKGVYVDREDALARAKAGLEARGIKLATKAKEEGIKEGQDIAKTKQQLSAVGETGAQPKVDPDTLSPSEFAKYHQLPRSPY